MADFQLPPFQSTLKGEPTPQAPNFSFNPGANVDSNIAQVALEKQRVQMQQNQQNQDAILKTVGMASQLAQSFVEASKTRQQRDAIRAYQALQPDQKITPILLANPAEASQAIINQQLPKAPTTLEGLIARGLTTGNKNIVTQAETAKKDIQKPSAPKLTQIQKSDGLHQVLVDAKTGAQTDLGLGKQPVPPIGKIFQSTADDGTIHNKRLENDGTISDLGIAPDKNKQKISAQAQGTADFARTMLPHIDEMRQIVHEAAGKGFIGPTAGRVYGQFLAGKVGSTGNADADQLLGKLRAVDTLIKSGTLKVHFGSRGGQQMYQHFSDVLNSGKQSEAEINGALDGIKSFLDGYANMGQNAPALPGNDVKTKAILDALRTSLPRK